MNTTKRRPRTINPSYALALWALAGDARAQESEPAAPEPAAARPAATETTATEPNEAPPPTAAPTAPPPTALPPTPPARPPTLPPNAASAGEQAEIERALAADAALAATPQPTPADGPPPAPAGGAGSAALNPDLALVASVALAAFSDDEPLQSGGHDPQRDGFNLQALEMAAQAAVDPYFRFDTFLAFSEEGVEIEEVYATTLALPWGLQARVGQFLTRFGRINATHLHAWELVDQPLAIGRLFGAEGNRGLGVELSWLTPLPWYVELVGSLTDAAGDETAKSFYGADDLGVESPLDLQSTGALKQFFPLSDDWSLAWGLSFAGGPNSTGQDNRTEIYGTDLYLKFRPITSASYTTIALQLEAFFRRREIPDDRAQDGHAYLQLSWRFAQRWSTALRHEWGSPTFDTSGARVLDELDPYWVGHRQRTSASLAFAPSEFSRFRLQGASDWREWERSRAWAAFLAFEVSVGAHGAHPF